MIRRLARLLGVLVTLLAVLLGASGCTITVSSAESSSTATTVGGTDPGDAGVDPDSGLPYVDASALLHLWPPLSS